MLLHSHARYLQINLSFDGNEKPLDNQCRCLLSTLLHFDLFMLQFLLKMQSSIVASSTTLDFNDEVLNEDESNKILVAAETCLNGSSGVILLELEFLPLPLQSLEV